MSQNFQSIIRPFQSAKTAPAVADLSSGQKSTPPVLLNFGRSGSGKTMTKTFNSTTTFYMQQYEVEKSSSDPAF